MRNLRFILGSLIVALSCSFVALAQTGSIEGTVTDKSGAVITGADIAVVNLDTKATRVVTSSGTGAYTLTSLPVGRYEITVKKDGFRAYKIAEAVLTVDQVLAANVQLEPGAVSEEIQVQGSELPPVDLDTAQVSNLVDAREIVDLPLITRNPYSLVLLSPGTIQTNTSLGGFSVNGSRERNNNFLLDGVDNNDTSVPGIQGGVLNANPDSTEEFRVITSNFNAEYGRNTGAIIDVVTKSGTNHFHGDVYEFGRWNSFGGARDWFNPRVDPSGAAQPMNPYVRNQFGYSIGGPIIKNKTFFFFNEEFNRFRTATTNTAVVPTAAFKTGLFTFNGPNGPVPVDLTAADTQGDNPNGFVLDPTVQKILALYPNPTSLNPDGFTGNITFPTGSKFDAYNTVARIDHQFTNHENLALRYGYDHNVDPDPFHDDVLPGGIGATASKGINQAASANLTSIISPNLLNNFIFGWNHIYAPFTCNHKALDSTGPVDQFGNGRDYYFDPFASFGCLDLVADGQFRKTGTTSYSEGLNWIHGSHNLKFGFDFRNVGESGADNFFSRRQLDLETDLQSGVTLTNVPGATLQLEDAASALWGFVVNDSEARFFNKSGTRVGSDDKFFRQHEYDWYGQDAWKIRRNFTLSLGLRYQFDGVPYEEHGNYSNLLTPPDAFPVVFSIVGPGTGKQVYKNDWSDIEPRVGFSWDPWGDGKTAVRGAFGIFHDRVFGNLFGNARGNPPFEQDYSSFFPNDTLNNLFGTNGVPTFVPNTTPSATVADESLISPIIMDPHFRNPVSNSWNLGVQRELGSGFALDVSYVASEAHHIFREMDGNPPVPALVNALVAYCSAPNSFTNVFGDTTSCSASTVTKSNLFVGSDFNGTLPLPGVVTPSGNAVAHNALFQPFFIRSVGNSTYNSLQVKLTKRMSHGLQLQGAYTYGHAIDDSGDPIIPGAGNRGFPRNSRNLAEERGNSDNDIRHVAVVSYIWEVPIGRGKGYLNSGVLGKVLEGFEFSGITSAQTGLPFDVYSTRDSERTGLSNRADLVADPFASGSNGAGSGLKPFFTNYDSTTATGAFAQPAYGRAGNIGRNHFHGPNLVNFNLSLAKKMTIFERVKTELRFESYNLFNHPQFTNPGSDPGAFGNQFGSPIFGLITHTVSQPDGTTSARQIQAALKVTF